MVMIFFVSGLHLKKKKVEMQYNPEHWKRDLCSKDGIM